MNMDNIRIGNTVHINFSCIDKATQQAIDLSTVDNLSVAVIANGCVITEKYAITGGNITLSLNRKDQTELGVYEIIVSFILNGDDCAYNKALFRAVASSDEATYNVPNDQEVITIPVQGVVDFISSVHLDYNALRNKPAINGIVLDSDITSTELGLASLENLKNYVDKEPNKSLMTDAERAKLASLENYDDTAILNELAALVGIGDTSPVINTLTEVYNFLEGYNNNQKLSQVIPTNARQVGADPVGSAETAFANSKQYTNTESQKLLTMIQDLQRQINELK